MLDISIKIANVQSVKDFYTYKDEIPKYFKLTQTKKLVNSGQLHSLYKNLEDIFWRGFEDWGSYNIWSQLKESFSYFKTTKF